jgi:lambda family phage portal protein
MSLLSFFGRSAAPTPEPTRVEPTLARPSMPTRGPTRMMFAAANHDRSTTNWPTTPLPADTIVERNQRVLVARSREQAANNDYARHYLRIVRRNVVGPNGPMLQAQVKKANGTLDAEANTAVETGWAEWGKPENCDVTGKRSWGRIVRSCVNTAARDGEFMARMVYGRDAGPWGFAVQTIDPQRCPIELSEPARPDGTFIRQGIKFNRYGRPLAYAFSTTDEAEGATWYGALAVTWVDASEIIHGFIEDMEGQKRGLPWMATGLFRMRHLNGFEDAVVMNARAGASKGGFIQWKQGFGPELEDEEEVPEFTAEPLTFQTLPEGAELVDWTPQFPDSATGPFAKHLLRGAAAGWGTSYVDLANDLEGVNFSSIRQGTLNEREDWKELQEWVIETLCARVQSAWLPIALLGGRLVTPKGRTLSAANPDKFAAATWQGRRWDWIDPNADMKAAEGRKNNFLASPSSIIREGGQDPQAVWNEAARDMRAQVDAMVAEGFDKAKAEELVMNHMGMAPKKPAPEPKAKDEPAA